MTFRLPPPPKDDPPSALLMRAIGRVPSGWYAGHGSWIEIIPLVEVGITAGYLDGGDTDCLIGLSAKGLRWYERDPLKRA